MQQSLKHWLEHRAAQWQILQQQLAAHTERRNLNISQAMALVLQFRSLTRDLSLARQVLPNSQLTLFLQAMFIKAHETLYRKPHFIFPHILHILRSDIPRLVHRNRVLIAATYALFILTAIAGWLLVYHYPQTVSLFASEEMIDVVQKGGLWTDNLLNIMPSSILSVSIMTNNIVVAITAFVLGVFYGLGTLYIISVNGLMLGGIFAFTRQYDLDGALFRFVVAHGVVELSVICLAGAAGVALGEAIMRPGDKTRVAAFHAAVKDGGKLLLLCVLFLIGAGLIEGYVSPNDAFPLQSRLVIGFGYGFILLVVVTGKIWRRRV